MRTVIYRNPRCSKSRATLQILKDHDVDAEWISLMVENPILIERPIVVTAVRAAIGRPPESVLAIL